MKEKQRLDDTISELLKYERFHEIEVISRVGGLSNENYLVSIDGRNHIIRVPGQAMKELEICTLISESMNAIKFFNSSNKNFVPIRTVNGIKVQRYINGAKTYEDEDVRNNISKVCDVISLMHYNTERLVTHFNLNAVLNKYIAAYFVRQRTLNHELMSVVKVAREVDSYLRSTKAFKVPSHNDTLANNFIESPSGDLYLIDYEYAGQNYYAYDLAAIIVECNLNEKESHDFVVDYMEKSMKFDEIPIELVKKQIQVCILYQDVMWGVWALVKAYNLEIVDNAMLEYGNARIQRACERKSVVEEIINQ